MKENTRAAVWVLFLTFAALFGLFVVFAVHHQKGHRENEDMARQEKAISATLQTVYQKLTAANGRVANKENLRIGPEDLRKAFARGGELLGELPSWLPANKVFIAREPVPFGSGKFMCFVVLGKGVFPFGLTTQGETRYADAGEIKREQFVPLVVSATP